MSRTLTGLLLLGAGLLLLGLVAVGPLYELWHAERIYYGVHVWGVSVGGLRPAEAADVLQEKFTHLNQPTLTLRGADRAWDVRPIDLGFRLEAEATAQQAFAVGRSPGEGWFAHLRLLIHGRDLPPVVAHDEAIARLYLQTLAAQIDQPPVDAALVLEGTTPVVTPSQPGRALDVEATLAAIRRAEVESTVNLVLSTVMPQVIGAEAAQAHAERLMAEPFVLLHPAPRENDPGPWQLTPEELAPMLTTATVGGQLRITLNPEPMRAYLEELAPSLAITATNARFHFNEATRQLTVIAPSSGGRALDVEASLQSIAAAVEAAQPVAALVVGAAQAQYNENSSAEELGIRELVAEGDSYFIGSPSGRDFNIRLAASKFDGLVIAPGETFSFNGYLGEISEEAGYDESLITTGEILTMGVGGGICQVSTTVFRAALVGGYPIVERWAHYQRVGYYELRGYGPGFDATVYSPVLDFRFVNDRATPLLIETEIEEHAHRLVFRFYSTDDGRRVQIEGPAISNETEPEPPIYQLDEEQAPGTIKEWQTAQKGLTAAVERWVYDAQGNLLYHNVFISAYAPRRAVYLYGPGYEHPPELEAPAEIDSD